MVSLHLKGIPVSSVKVVCSCSVEFVASLLPLSMVFGCGFSLPGLSKTMCICDTPAVIYHPTNLFNRNLVYCFILDRTLKGVV